MKKLVFDAWDVVAGTVIINDRFQKLGKMKEKAEVVNDKCVIEDIISNSIKIRYRRINNEICEILFATLFLLLLLFMMVNVDLKMIFAFSFLLIMGGYYLLSTLKDEYSKISKLKESWNNRVSNDEKVQHFRSDIYELYDVRETFDGSHTLYYYYIKLQYKIVLVIDEKLYKELKKKKIKKVDVYFTEEMFNNYEFEIQPVKKD